MDGDVVPASEWNLMLQNGSWAQEVILGTNSDKIPVTGIAGVVGYYPNILVNGGQEVSQRNGTTLVNATTTATTTLDRWVAQMVAPTTAVSVQQVAAVDSGSQWAAAVNYNHVGGGGFVYYQNVENWQEFKGRTLFATARVQGSTTGCYMYVTDGLTSGLSSRTVAGTLTTLSASLTISTSATMVRVVFTFDASCFATIDNVMLCLSPSAIDYVPRPPAEEWLNCLRYYQKVKTSQAWRTSAAGEIHDVPIVFPVPMAATPTAALTAGTRANITSAALLDVTAGGCRHEATATATTTATSALNEIATLSYDP